MKHLLLNIFLLFCTLRAAAGIVVVDAEYGTPVNAVAVTDSTGLGLGLTAPDGSLPSLAQAAGPLTLRHIAFEPLTVSPDTIASGTIRLVPRTFAIPEVVVTDKFDVIRVEGYYRSYFSMGNSKEMGSSLGEGTVVYYLRPDKKGKANDKGKRYATTLYNRIVNPAKGTDSLSVSTGKQGTGMAEAMDDGLSLPLMLDTPHFAEADISAQSLVIPGKYSPLGTIGNNGNILTLTRDYLSDHKEHRYSPAIFKLLGLTADCLEYTVTQTYDASALGHRPADITSLLSMSQNVRIKGRGKLFRKLYGGEKVDFRINTEIFFTSISFLSKAEAKEARNADRLITVTKAPATVPPLDPAALALRQAAISSGNRITE